MDLQSVPEEAWGEALANYIKDTMRAQRIDYAELARRLEAAGLAMDRTSLANRINRRAFSATFLMQVMAALGEHPRWLAEVLKHLPQQKEG